ncbi:Putative zinc-finger [Halomonas cupida]|uniref:Putative zinc-finger n=3 Tax=Halomonas cupida TaxID=44933 RepID=A0A1M7L8Q4_9GAMM|nr:Putative zinc-finger [Halomonas cupida]
MMMCRAATRLMSKQLDGPLSLWGATLLRIHVMMCKACRRCQQQFNMLHDIRDPFFERASDSTENHERHQQAEPSRLSQRAHRLWADAGSECNTINESMTGLHDTSPSVRSSSQWDT